MRGEDAGVLSFWVTGKTMALLTERGSPDVISVWEYTAFGVLGRPPGGDVG